LQLHADRGSTHSLLGNIALALGDRPRAEDHFRTAIRVAPHESGPRGQLATLLEEMAAELRSRGPATPSDEQLAQKLARDVRRLRREEHELLKADLRRAAGFPQVHAVHYRVALSSYLIGDLAGLLENLQEAHRIAPQEPTYLVALVQALRETGRWDEAVLYAERLKNLVPENPEFQQLWEAVRARR
jgi:tetratricopeptide (TPR) repeat protein